MQVPSNEEDEVSFHPRYEGESSNKSENSGQAAVKGQVASASMASTASDISFRVKIMEGDI